MHTGVCVSGLSQGLREECVQTDGGGRALRKDRAAGRGLTRSGVPLCPTVGVPEESQASLESTRSLTSDRTRPGGFWGRRVLCLGGAQDKSAAKCQKLAISLTGTARGSC